MGSFFKMFFASLLAFVVFCFIIFFLLFAVIGSIASDDKPEIADGSVLVLDLSKFFNERKQPDAFAAIAGDDEMPGLYDVIRLIHHAKDDENIAGIYVIANGNANGFGSSNEIRNALANFKTSKKFIIAHGDVMSQGAYFVANIADKVYVNPAGGFDWSGFNVSLAFVKGTLEKLQIEPQIFYAGKFKSATEPLRATEMTPENELQTKEWLNDLYYYFLQKTSETRKIDTTTLHQLANTAAVQTPEQAVQNRLIDGVKYDDEVKAEIKTRLKSGKYDKLHLVSIGTYSEAINFRRSGKDRIALIYAEGDIIDGEGDNDNIGGDKYANLIRRARLDKSVKAIVLRVNSGGGSALASEKIWRELEMAQADNKPVVVSFGDVAASGGYYIACGADSIT
jgi:protease IV